MITTTKQQLGHAAIKLVKPVNTAADVACSIQILTA